MAGRDLVTLRLHVCDAPSPRLPSDDVPRSRPGPCFIDRRAGGGSARPGGVEPHCVALFARAGTRFFCSGCAPPALAKPCGGAPGGNLVVVAQRKVGEVAARRRGRQDGHRRRGGGDSGRIAASAHLAWGGGVPCSCRSKDERSVTEQTESQKICCDYKIYEHLLATILETHAARGLCSAAAVRSARSHGCGRWPCWHTAFPRPAPSPALAPRPRAGFHVGSACIRTRSWACWRRQHSFTRAKGPGGVRSSARRPARGLWRRIHMSVPAAHCPSLPASS